MRKTQFRVWIISEKRYIYIVGFCFEDKTGIRIWYFKNNMIVNQSFTTDNIIIEQYTGIKDKAGKEIYEGDIISRCNYNSLYIVIYNDQYCKFEMNRIMDKYPFDFSELKAFHEKIKIIGNIHENPELLERN